MDWSDPAVLLQGIAVAINVALFFMGVEYGTKWG